MSITGAGFDPGGVYVDIGGAGLDSLVVVSPYEITGLTPIGTVGPVDVEVTNIASGLPSEPLIGGFTYFAAFPPVVDDIPDQTVVEGSIFSSIKLDDYVADGDHADSEISWSYSGNNELSVSINVNRRATIQVPHEEWNGSETIIFRATDPDSLFDEDTATFTITAYNDPPIMTDIPDQAIIGSGSFAAISLDDYVDDPDHPDSVMIWNYWG